jgi:hypothetical protein
MGHMMSNWVSPPLGISIQNSGKKTSISPFLATGNVFHETAETSLRYDENIMWAHSTF